MRRLSFLCSDRCFGQATPGGCDLTTNIAGAYLKQPTGVPSSTPPPPILEIFKYGTVGRFGRLQVSETNVKRDRAKRPKCSTAIREAAALCCQKSAVFHLPCKWLIDIRCYAWLLLLIRTTTIQASFRNCNAIYRRDMFYRASSAFRQFPFCWATHFARQDSGQIF